MKNSYFESISLHQIFLTAPVLQKNKPEICLDESFILCRSAYKSVFCDYILTLLNQWEFVA